MSEERENDEERPEAAGGSSEVERSIELLNVSSGSIPSIPSENNEVRNTKRTECNLQRRLSDDQSEKDCEGDLHQVWRKLEEILEVVKAGKSQGEEILEVVKAGKSQGKEILEVVKAGKSQGKEILGVVKAGKSQGETEGAEAQHQISLQDMISGFRSLHLNMSHNLFQNRTKHANNWKILPQLLTKISRMGDEVMNLERLTLPSKMIATTRDKQNEFKVQECLEKLKALMTDVYSQYEKILTGQEIESDDSDEAEGDSLAWRIWKLSHKKQHGSVDSSTATGSGEGSTATGGGDGSTTEKATTLSEDERNYIERINGLRYYGFIKGELLVVLSQEVFDNPGTIMSDVKEKLAPTPVIFDKGYEVRAQHGTGCKIIVKEESPAGPAAEDSSLFEAESLTPTSSVTCIVLSPVLGGVLREPRPIICTVAHMLPDVTRQLPETFNGDIICHFSCRGGGLECVLGCTQELPGTITEGSEINPSMAFLRVREEGGPHVEARDILCVPATANYDLLLTQIKQGDLCPTEVFEGGEHDALEENEEVFIVSCDCNNVMRGTLVASNQSVYFTIRGKSFMFYDMYQLSVEGFRGTAGESGSAVFIIRGGKPVLLAFYCAVETPPRSVRVEQPALFALPFHDNINSITHGEYQAFVPSRIYNQIG